MIYIDFGSGDNFSKMKKAKLRGFYTIAINKEKYKLMETDDWKLSVDETHIGNFSDEFNIPKADEWNCSSVLEHMLEDEIDKELKGIRSKVSTTGTGDIHIDLTDHFGGFRHYSEDDYARNDYPRWYLNRIRADVWDEIIKKYFVYVKIAKSYQKNEIKWLDFLGCKHWVNDNVSVF
tara:strand:+ start:32 stop:562 length:531 start_codon:yes stop_codon:yes gene_type:complete